MKQLTNLKKNDIIQLSFKGEVMKKSVNLGKKKILSILGAGFVLVSIPVFSVSCTPAQKGTQQTIAHDNENQIDKLKKELTQKLKEYNMYKKGNVELVYNYVTYNDNAGDIDDIFIGKEMTGRLLSESFYAKDTSVIELYEKLQSTPEASEEIMATKNLADSLVGSIDDDLIGVNPMTSKQVANWMYLANLIDRHGLVYEPSNFRNTSVAALQIAIMENLYATTIARSENFNKIKKVVIDESKLDGYYTKPIDIIDEDPILRLKPTIRNLEKKAKYNIDARISDREANEALKRSRN